MTYTFDMKICDNEVDGNYDRFPVSSLKQIEKLVVGKRGTFKGKQVAKVLSAYVVSDNTQTTKAGDTYLWVRARVNIELNDETSALIYEIEHGSKNPVSVGCSVEHMVCSICGAESCNHVPGDVYGGQLCYKEMYGVQDIYEWSFAAPRQKTEE